MKIALDRATLAEAAAWTARSLPARPPIPVLAGTMLAAEPARLVLSGFDYEVSTRMEIEADVAEPGRVLVSGRLLADIARSLPERPVELSSDGSRVVLTCGSTRFALLTLPVEDYPALPSMPSASGSLAGSHLASATGQVAVAAGRDDTLPVLTGVLLEVDGEKLTLSATDRYRAAIRELDWTPVESGLTATALVPSRTLLDIAKALGTEQAVTVALSSPGAASSGAGAGLVGFEGGGRRTTTRLLDGQFPRLNSLFPGQYACVATVETAPLVESVKRVALVAERNMPVRLTFSDGEVALEAGSGDESQAAETLEASVTGDVLEVAFNPGYLLDALGALATPYAQLAFTQPSKPAVITGRDDVDGANDEGVSSYRHLLMPIRLAG